MRRSHEPGGAAHDVLGVAAQQDADSPCDDTGRDQVHSEVAVDNEKPVDQFRVVRNLSFSVADRVRPPADPGLPAGPAVVCCRLDLDPFGSVRGRYEQVVYCRFYRDGYGTPTQRKPGRGKRRRSLPQIPERWLQGRLAAGFRLLVSKVAQVKTQTQRVRPYPNDLNLMTTP